MRDTACLDAYSRILTPYTKPFLAPLTTDKRSWFAGLSNVTRVSVKNMCVKKRWTRLWRNRWMADIVARARMVRDYEGSLGDDCKRPTAGDDVEFVV